jgi:hypothetical protein
VNIARSEQFIVLLDDLFRFYEKKYGNNKRGLARLGITNDQKRTAERFATTISKPIPKLYDTFIEDAQATAKMERVMKSALAGLSTCRADLLLAHKLGLYLNRPPNTLACSIPQKPSGEELLVWTSSTTFTRALSRSLALSMPWTIRKCPTPGHLVNGLLSRSVNRTHVLLVWPGDLRVDVATISEFDAETFFLTPISTFSTISQDNVKANGVLSLPKLSERLMCLSTT